MERILRTQGAAVEYLAFLPVNKVITDEVKRSLRNLYKGHSEQALKALGSETILHDISVALAENPNRYDIAMQLLEFLEMPKPRAVFGAQHELAAKVAAGLGITFTDEQVAEFDQKLNEALRKGAASFEMEVMVNGEPHQLVIPFGTQ